MSASITTMRWSFRSSGEDSVGWPPIIKRVDVTRFDENMKSVAKARWQ